eukprot:7424381-Pyramimonas_sp.AAC.1
MPTPPSLIRHRANRRLPAACVVEHPASVGAALVVRHAPRDLSSYTWERRKTSPRLEPHLRQRSCWRYRSIARVGMAVENPSPPPSRCIRGCALCSEEKLRSWRYSPSHFFRGEMASGAAGLFAFPNEWVQDLAVAADHSLRPFLGIGSYTRCGS